MSAVVDYAAAKAKSHTAYFIEKYGKKFRVPGTTTITGVMDKPALVKWANGLGLQGIESGKYVDVLAETGTLCHWLIQQHVSGVKIDETELHKVWTGNQIDSAENGFIRFMEWEQKTGFKMIGSELPLVSVKHEFGGTIDLYGCLTLCQNRMALVDIKTSKAIYGEHRTQVGGGYAILMEENCKAVDDVIILRVGRTVEEGFDAQTLTNQQVGLHQDRFLVCRQLYEANKAIKTVEGW